MLVESWLHRAARARPSRAAVNDVTYAELLARATSAAALLPPGARVGLALAPGVDFAIALHATFLARATAVPVDLRLAAAQRPAVDILVEAPLDGPHAAAPRPVATGGPALRGQSPADRLDLGRTAIVVHTSGTTSVPKPVELTFGNWLWSALGSGVALGVDPDERWLCTLPLSHVGGLSILLRSAIAQTTALVHERFETDRVLAELRRRDGPTMVSLVPTTLARLLDAGLARPPALRWALLGGAPLPPALLERAAEAGVPVAPTYGLTEACSQVTTFGAPLFCTRVSLAADGEILVSGKTVAGTAGRARPVLRTGDLGAWDDAGRLQLIGRKADTIISGGENIAPAEIEAVLEGHPAVAEAAVFGRAHPEWGEAVVARVRLRDGARATPRELGAHCRARLAAFKVPRELELTAEPLPRTASGKLVRRAL
jgi:O-succinylbenzoic acid--CoA ligase